MITQVSERLLFATSLRVISLNRNDFLQPLVCCCSHMSKMKRIQALETYKRSLHTSTLRGDAKKVNWRDYEKDSDIPRPPHPDDMPFGGVDVNPFGMSAKEQRKFWTHPLCLCLFGASLWAFLVGVINSIHADKKISPDIITSEGEGKSGGGEGHLQPLFLLMSHSCPQSNMVKNYLDYHGLPYTAVREAPKFLLLTPPEATSPTTQGTVPTLGLAALRRPLLASGSHCVLPGGAFAVSVMESYLANKGEKSLVKVIEQYPFSVYEDAQWRFMREGELALLRQVVESHNNHKIDTSDPAAAEIERTREWCDERLSPLMCVACHGNLATSIVTVFSWCKQQNWRQHYAVMGSLGSVYLDTLLASLTMYSRARDIAKRLSVTTETFSKELSGWLESVRRKGGKFHGGKHPDIADLAVYSIVQMADGTPVMESLVSSSPLLSPWLAAVRAEVEAASGRARWEALPPLTPAAAPVEEKLVRETVDQVEDRMDRVHQRMQDLARAMMTFKGDPGAVREGLPVEQF